MINSVESFEFLNLGGVGRSMSRFNRRRETHARRHFTQPFQAR